jgi:hypothetical protein
VCLHILSNPYRSGLTNNRDTVSSIGIIRGKSLPYTDVFDENHICYFRHALALDERRVKFLPEYVCGGESYMKRERSNEPTAKGNLSQAFTADQQAKVRLL